MKRKEFRKYPFASMTSAIESRNESVNMLFNRFSGQLLVCEYLNESAGHWQKIINLVEENE